MNFGENNYSSSLLVLDSYHKIRMDIDNLEEVVSQLLFMPQHIHHSMLSLDILNIIKGIL